MFKNSENRRKDLEKCWLHDTSPCKNNTNAHANAEDMLSAPNAFEIEGTVEGIG